MSANRHHIDTELFNINRDLAVSFTGIDMSIYSVFRTLQDLQDLFHRLDCPDRMICECNHKEDRLICDRLFQLFQIDKAIPVNLEVGNLESALFEEGCIGQNIGIINDRCDYMVSLISISQKKSLDRYVIRQSST